MARQITYSIGVINITVQPHSPEKYMSLFRNAFSETPPTPWLYHGNDLIVLKAIHFEEDEENPYIHGIVYRFTKIREGDWYDATKGIPLENDADKPKIDLKHLFPNLTGTEFCFMPKGHRLFLVTQHKKSSISLAYFAKALHGLLNRDHLVDEYGPVDISVETDVKTIESIMSMDILSRLIIRVNMPNNDDISELKQKYIERLKNQNGRTHDERLTAEKGKTLVPDDETKAHMQLALSNGFIQATGYENDVRVEKKSSEMPIVYKEQYDSDVTTLFDSLLGYARSLLPFFTSRQKKDEDFR